MHFEPGEIYHVYNRGNDKQRLFFTDSNYLFFLTKIKAEWKKYCEILCYCLMANHFHFMLVPNEEACKNIMQDNKLTNMQQFSNSIGKTLSSYTRAINNQNNTIGNLFQKKTKAKCLNEENILDTSFGKQDYLLTCFNYIHLNPTKARIVDDLKDWPYSSYPDYYGFRNDNLCNKPLSMKLLEITDAYFTSDSLSNQEEGIIKNLF